MNILHGLTGSVAANVAHNFGREYQKRKWHSRLVRTTGSEHFSLQERFFNEIYNDENEWNLALNKRVLHIELIKLSEVFVIAPCSANTLAKIANGICDNLLTCCARAWDFKKKFIIAPAMNSNMWNHPTTKEHLDKIKKWGIVVVPPVEKKLFCGDTGIGAMENVEEIIKYI